jgi:hypothetical protein
MQDAMQPVLPNAHQLQRMPCRDGTAASTGYGDPLGTRSTSTVLHSQPSARAGRCLLSQDNDDIQAVRTQIQKARTTWARVSNVLRGQNAPPRISAKLYKAVVQSLLLYGSKTWVISKLVLARLEGFHIQAMYKMPKHHVPQRSPDRR